MIGMRMCAFGVGATVWVSLHDEAHEADERETHQHCEQFQQIRMLVVALVDEDLEECYVNEGTHGNAMTN